MSSGKEPEAGGITPNFGFVCILVFFKNKNILGVKIKLFVNEWNEARERTCTFIP